MWTKYTKLQWSQLATLRWSDGVLWPDPTHIKKCIIPTQFEACIITTATMELVHEATHGMPPITAGMQTGASKHMIKCSVLEF